MSTQQPTYEELWKALEQVSSGTIIIGEQRLNVPDEVAEWADEIVWPTKTDDEASDSPTVDAALA